MNVEIGTETPIFLFLGIFVSKFRYFVFAVYSSVKIKKSSHDGPFEADYSFILILYRTPCDNFQSFFLVNYRAGEIYPSLFNK